jgi:hypothetical protein
MRIRFVFLAGLTVTALAVPVPALASPATTGLLFHDGAVVGTVIVSSPVPAGSGTDPFYSFTNPAAGQLGIAGVAPGDGPYHGGNWQVWSVRFNVTPYLITSDEALFAAARVGDVTITRVPSADFHCPVTSTAVAGA